MEVISVETRKAFTVQTEAEFDRFIANLAPVLMKALPAGWVAVDESSPPVP
jgi:hypothetical protein